MTIVAFKLDEAAVAVLAFEVRTAVAVVLTRTRSTRDRESGGMQVFSNLFALVLCGCRTERGSRAAVWLDRIGDAVARR
jgi:hypothetical protein